MIHRKDKTDDDKTVTTESYAADDQSEESEDFELEEQVPMPMSEEVEMPASAPRKKTLKRRISLVKNEILGKRTTAPKV